MYDKENIKDYNDNYYGGSDTNVVRLFWVCA